MSFYGWEAILSKNNRIIQRRVSEKNDMSTSQHILLSKNAKLPGMAKVNQRKQLIIATLLTLGFCAGPDLAYAQTGGGIALCQNGATGTSMGYATQTVLAVPPVTVPATAQAACGSNASFNLFNSSNSVGTQGGSSPNANVYILATAPSFGTMDVQAANGLTLGSSNGRVNINAGGGVFVSNFMDLSNHQINRLAAGVAPTDAVNVSQLEKFGGGPSDTINNATIGMGIRYVRTNETGLTQSDSFARAQGSTAVGYNATTVTTATNALALGNGATANFANDVALGAGSTTAVAVSTSGTTIGNVPYTFAGITPTSTVSVGAVGAERTITNVAAGRLDPTSTDAINGSQLAATNSHLTNLELNLGQAKTTYFQVDENNPSKLGLPQPTGNFATAGGSLAVASGNYSTALGEEAVATKDNSVALGANSTTTVGAQTGYAALGLKAPQNSAGEVSIGSAGNERKITNVAAGSALTDAVNVSQLQAITGDTSSTYIANNGFGIRYVRTNETGLAEADAHAQAPGSTAVGYNATASSANSVAVGRDAKASHANSVALGAGSATQVGAQTNYQAYGLSAPQTSSGEVNVGDRQITGVAPGMADTDAVNVSQLKTSVGDINKQVNALSNVVENNRRDANAGSASAMAVAGLPQPTSAGHSMLSLAASTYSGQSAMALGLSTISENNRWVYKVSLATNTRKNTGAVLGVGRQW